MEEERITCELCSKEISEETGIEIYDGYICQECAEKLSPFASDLELADLEDIEQQLEMRESNQEKLRNFHPTRSFQYPGMTEKIYLDDAARTFLVTENQNILRENPDILSLDEVMDAEVLVEDDRETIGDHFYRYTYDLYLNISMDHPYVDEISILLNKDPLIYDSEEKSFLGFGGFDPESQADYSRVLTFGQDLSDALMEAEEVNHSYDVKLGEFSLESEEAEGSAEPGKIHFCPWCGSKLSPDVLDTCPNCGGNL